MPTATDLVTDLPADFEVFGQAVATSMADLLGGTTGQILAKNSATDMDFVWIANDQGDITGITAGNGISVTNPTGPVPTVAINTAVTADLTTAQTLTNKTLTSPALTTPTISTLTTNGDLVYGTGSGALSRLGIGSTAQVLTVAGGVPSWAAPAGGGKVLQVVQATTSTQTQITATSMQDTGISCSITPTSATSKVLVLINGQVYAYKVGNGATGDFQIVRGATPVLVCDGGTGSFAFGVKVGSNTIESAHIISTAYLDSPATTSSTTYKLQAACNQASELNWQLTSAHTSTIVLMEIGA